MSNKRNDRQPKRAPLADGNPRRLTDARCAWKKMDDEQRLAFLEDLRVEGWTLTVSDSEVSFGKDHS